MPCVSVSLAIYVRGVGSFFIFIFQNMTQLTATSFRINQLEQQACRWKYDGADNEIVYFTINSNNEYCDNVLFMGQTYYFVSKKCPKCA